MAKLLTQKESEDLRKNSTQIALSLQADTREMFLNEMDKEWDVLVHIRIGDKERRLKAQHLIKLFDT